MHDPDATGAPQPVDSAAGDGEDAQAGRSPLDSGELVIIGTGHVFKIQQAIRDAIVALQPDVVFVELDRGRLAALAAQARGDAPTQERRGGWVQKRLHAFQQGVAERYGTQAGGEMLAAVAAAQETGARVMLVDRPADETLRRTLGQLTWKERFRAVRMILASVLLAPFRRRRGDDLEAELRKYNENPAAALDEIGRDFPTVRRVVIEERDEIMARGIRHGLLGARLGVAVVGDGHVDGLMRLLSEVQVTAYRLPDVRDGRLPRPTGLQATGNTDDVSFGFDTQV